MRSFLPGEHAELEFLKTVPKLIPMIRMSSPAAKSNVRKYLEIAFAFPLGSPQEVFIEGILQYANEHQRPWSYMLAPESNSVSIRKLAGWPGDGVIAALNTAAEAKCAKDLSIPVVNMSSALKESPVPRIMVDNCGVGEFAAEHFLERGYENLAYYGMRQIEYSQRRLDGFINRLSEYHLKPTIYLAPPTFTLSGNSWLQQQKTLTAWLQTLELPIGIFAVSDARARQLLNSCQQLGLKIPEQVAVLGVDDQKVICEHYHPAISSIARDSVLEGYEAARLLDDMLEGRKIKQHESLVRPTGIVTRESTDAVAVQDMRLRRVLSYLRDNIEEPVTIAEICKDAEISRRWLEYAFNEVIGESPFSYIRRRKLQHAKKLLADEVRTPVNEIAKRCGYTSSNQLAKAFRSMFGESPREYRNRITRR